MKCDSPAQGPDRYLVFTSAQGICYRLQVEDDPVDVCSFTVRVTPLVDENAAPENPTPASHPILATLTSREQDVALLVVQGFTNDQIGNHLCISLSTVKSHLQNIFAKTHVANRTALVALFHDSAR